MTDNPLSDVPKHIRDAERDREIFREYVERRTRQVDLAAKHGLAQSRIAQIIAEQRANTPEETREEMRRKSLAFYERLIDSTMEVAEQTPAPVFVGKDGDVAIDPENMSVVRDHSARLSALALAARHEEQIRKLMGLDEATKIVSTQTVHYKLEGVNTDDLK